MSSIVFLIIFFWIISVALKNANAQSLEAVLRIKNFQDVRRLTAYQNYGRIYLTAFSNSMKYLFVRNLSSLPITFMSHEELKFIQEISRGLKCDRVIVYVNSISVPIELTKTAALYNIEVWNKTGDSDFESYRTVKASKDSSRLAQTLKPENAIFEHRKNGVIAKDTCHIAPSVSPIQEEPTKLFKKKGPQRL